MTDRLDNGDFGSSPEEILAASADELTQRLLASGVNTQFAANDLNLARGTAQENLQIFRTFFAPSIARTIHKLAKLASYEVGPYSERPNHQTLAKLCTLVLTSGPTGHTTLGGRLRGRGSSQHLLR